LIIPPALEEPSVPALDEMELGRAKQNQFEIALRTATTYDNELEQLARVIAGLCQEHRVTAAATEV
jgi:hypothetical protein